MLPEPGRPPEVPETLSEGAGNDADSWRADLTDLTAALKRDLDVVLERFSEEAAKLLDRALPCGDAFELLDREGGDREEQEANFDTLPETLDSCQAGSSSSLAEGRVRGLSDSMELGEEEDSTTANKVVRSQHFTLSYEEEEALRENFSRGKSQKGGPNQEDSDGDLVASESRPSRRSSMKNLSGLQRYRLMLREVVTHRYFESFFCVLILTNTLYFGFEVEYMAAHRILGTDDIFVFSFVSNVYTVSFLLELVLRMLAYGLFEFFCAPEKFWNIFDVVIVGISVLETSVLLTGSGGGTQNLGYMRMLRIVRTARILRIIRIVSFFRSLRLLLLSVLNTLRSLFWTALLLLMIMYVFAIMFTQAATQALVERNEEAPEFIERYYGTLARSVYTLFLCITGGVSWEIVAEPLAQVHWAWLQLLLVYIAFTYFAVLNVVTGVFCQTAIESAVQDQDEVMAQLQAQQKSYVDQLTELFEDVDEDKSGELTIDEFEQLLDDERLAKYCASLDLTIDSAWALFKLLDDDGSGSITAEEFVKGCLRLKGGARGIDLQLLAYQLKWVVNRFERFMDFSNVQFQQLQETCAGIIEFHAHQQSLRSPSKKMADSAASRHLVSKEMTDSTACTNGHGSFSSSSWSPGQWRGR